MAHDRTAGADERFEELLRTRLHALADRAPSHVRALDEIAVVHANRRPARPKRHRRIAGIGATIGTLAAGFGLTTIALHGAGTAGAASPEDATRQFVTALESEDVLGMIDILDPDEVPAVRTAVESARTEAERVGLVSGGLSLDAVQGVDVDLADLALSTTSVLDGVAVVTATSGTASISFDPSTFPLGDALTSWFDRGALSGSASTELGQGDVPIQLATVERDGRWYVSTSYTIAEYVRTATDVGPVTGVDPVVAVGSATAEEAATAWYQRLVSFDVAGAASLAAPGSGDAVLRYANLWLPEIGDAVDRARSSGWDLHIDGLQYQVGGDGSLRTMVPTAFAIRGTTSDSLVQEPVLDPTLPTMIYDYAGTGFVLVAAGDPLPASIDGLPLETDFTTLDGAGYNSTSADENGAVYPMLLPSQVQSGPQAIGVELVDGCISWSGAAAQDLFGTPVSTSPVEVLTDGSYRSCDGSLGGLGLLGVALGGGGTGLPSVEVEEVDGRWYVSPLGTITDLVLDLVRNVPDGSSLFDSTLGSYVYGVNHQSLVLFLSGQPLDQLSDECRLLVTDDGTTVTGLIEPPDLAQVRRCWQSGMYGGGGVIAVSSSGGVIEEPLPATQVPAVPVTASEAPVEATVDTLAVPETVAATAP